MRWNRIYRETSLFSSPVSLYYTERVKPLMYVLGIQTQQPGSVRSVLHVAVVGLSSRSISTCSVHLVYFLLLLFVFLSSLFLPGHKYVLYWLHPFILCFGGLKWPRASIGKLEKKEEERRPFEVSLSFCFAIQELKHAPTRGKPMKAIKKRLLATISRHERYVGRK